MSFKKEWKYHLLINHTAADLLDFIADLIWISAACIYFNMAVFTA